MTQDSGLKTILITGGCGFIGTNLVKYLLEKRVYDIKIFDNLSVGRKGHIDQVLTCPAACCGVKTMLGSRGRSAPGQGRGSCPAREGERCEARAPRVDSILRSTNATSVELIVGDIRNPQEIERAAEGVDGIVHLAAYTGVRDSLANPEECFQVNALGTFNVLEACRKLGIERFIYASSNADVGEQALPIHEEMVTRPISVYGATKLIGEALCLAYYHAYGIKTISLRFSNIYGPYMGHKTSVIANFIRRAKAGKPLIIYGDGRQTRDFCHVRDICRAIELALTYNPPNPTNSMNSMNPKNLIFQLGTGKETQINDLALMVTGLSAKGGLGPQPEIKYEAPQAGDIRRNCSDIAKAREALGFEPEVGLEEGLSEVWKWWEAQTFLDP